MEISEKQYLKSKRIVEQYEKQLQDISDRLILEDTQLPIRCVKRLKKEGMVTLGDVRKLWIKEGKYGFMVIQGLGDTSQEDIRKELKISFEDFYKFRW